MDIFKIDPFESLAGKVIWVIATGCALIVWILFYIKNSGPDE